MKKKVHDFLNDGFGDAIVGEDDFRDQQSFTIKPDALVEICQAFLEDDDLDVRYLSDIASVDWLGSDQESAGRFEIVYNLYSLSHCYRFFLKIRLDEQNLIVPTLCDLFPSANWLEREVYDMMGIEFEGHPDLTKILTPDELEGFPLRKDFPLTWEQPVFSFNRDDPPEVIK